MSTDAYRKFEKQFHASGSEKADGYVPTWFKEMSDSEREIALDMLIEELQNSNHPIEAIASIGNGRAKHALSEKWKIYSQEEKKSQFILATQLTTLMNDPSYIEELEIRITELDKMLHIPLANSLEIIHIDSANNILKSIVMQSESRAARGKASKLLLDRYLPNISDSEREKYLQELKGYDENIKY